MAQQPAARGAAMTTSRRLAAVQPPMIPVVAGLIARHPGTISLAQGVVHYGPPPAVAAAVIAAAAEPSTSRYGRVHGHASLVTALEEKLVRDNGVTLGPARRLLVTAGGNMAFLTALLAIADPGDEVILLRPFYFNHDMAITMAGCRTVAVATRPDHGIDLAGLAAAVTPRTRAIVTVSPNNPTGAVYPAQDLAAVNRLCAERGLYHIADEAYEYFTYGVPHVSPLALPQAQPHTIGLYSLSKTYGMAGWRIGYVVLPAHLEEAAIKIQDTNLICPPIANQLGAAAAISCGPEWIRSRTVGFAAVRDLVMSSLAGLGDRVEAPRPDGAFYLFLRLRTALPEMTIVERLIAEHGVAVMPGSTFGTDGTPSIRIAYGALEEAAVAKAMGRLVAGLSQLLR